MSYRSIVAVFVRPTMRVVMAVVVATAMSFTALGPAEADPDDISRSANMSLLTNVEKRSPLTGTNSDLAFWGDYAFQGNYDGFTIWDISRPRSPRIVSQVLCPGGQGDVSVSEDGSLLFFSVDYARSSDSCASAPTSSADPGSFEGIRIFDISDLSTPEYVAAVPTTCGSHTHTLVPDGVGENVYLYVSSYGPADSFPNCQPPHDSISIVEVPLDDPGASSVVAEPVLFPGGGGPGTAGCHDITAYPDRRIAAGACMGDGILMDISDPVEPRVIERRRDRNFAFWHSATFSNNGTKVVFTDELGGGVAATCNEEVGPRRGADAIFDITGTGASRELAFRSYFKIPRYQSDTENCVAHNGSLIPVKGRDVMVQSWYQGGVSVMDFTDSANPREIGYWDRGALSDEVLIPAGTWSAYYYNGHIYSNDIDEGLDVLSIRGQRGAKRVKFDLLNAQTQYQYPEGRSRSATPRSEASAETGERRVIVPDAPGETSRTMAPQRARGLELGSRTETAVEANDADRAFMARMIPHHYQAIVMSRLIKSRTSDPQVRALANRIRVEQRLEIDVMKSWQIRNGLPATDERAAHRQMLDNPEMLTSMGMASRRQLGQLRQSEGTRADALFLDLMIPHHEGAIDSAERVGVEGVDLFVRQFSADLTATQAAQIDTMEQLRGD